MVVALIRSKRTSTNDKVFLNETGLFSDCRVSHHHGIQTCTLEHKIDDSKWAIFCVKALSLYGLMGENGGFCLYRPRYILSYFSSEKNQQVPTPVIWRAADHGPSPHLPPTTIIKHNGWPGCGYRHCPSVCLLLEGKHLSSMDMRRRATKNTQFCSK